MSAHPFGKQPKPPREPELWEYGEAPAPLSVKLWVAVLVALLALVFIVGVFL